MKKALLLVTASLLLSLNWAHAQNTLTFNDNNGTSNAVTLPFTGSSQSFSFDITLSIPVAS